MPTPVKRVQEVRPRQAAFVASGVRAALPVDEVHGVHGMHPGRGFQ